MVNQIKLMKIKYFISKYFVCLGIGDKWDLNRNLNDKKLNLLVSLGQTTIFLS